MAKETLDILNFKNLENRIKKKTDWALTLAKHITRKQEKFSRSIL